MKVILMTAAGIALSAMVVYDATQVPAADVLLAEAAAWIGDAGGVVAANIGFAVMTAERGQQLASPGDWIISDAASPRLVLSDDAFRATYAEAPEGAGVPDAPATVAQTDAPTGNAPADGLQLIPYAMIGSVSAASIAAIAGSVVTLDLPGSPTVDLGAGEDLTGQGYKPGDYYVEYKAPQSNVVHLAAKAEFEAEYAPATPTPAAEQPAA